MNEAPFFANRITFSLALIQVCPSTQNSALRMLNEHDNKLNQENKVETSTFLLPLTLISELSFEVSRRYIIYSIDKNRCRSNISMLGR